MLPYACDFLSIGCDFTRWGIDGDRNRVSLSPRIRYSSGDSLFRDTDSIAGFFRRMAHRS